MKIENLYQTILQVAEQLLREKGYNGWSYQDISSAVGIKKASIHYYFPRKEDLGSALIAQYHQKGMAYLGEASRHLFNAQEKLLALVKFYGQALNHPHSFCLFGMLAADLRTLPEKMESALKKSFEEQQNWVWQILEGGLREGLLKGVEPLDLEAYQIVSSLQGMLLIARLKEKPQEVFLENATRFLTNKFI